MYVHLIILNSIHTDVSIHVSTEDVKTMHNEFVGLAYATNSKEAYTAFVEKWTNTQPRYVAYVRSQWGKNLDKWVLGLRETPLQGIHTNNFIESWHQNLKYHFLNRASRLRPDNFLHTLVYDVVPDFRQVVIYSARLPRSNPH